MVHRYVWLALALTSLSSSVSASTLGPTGTPRFSLVAEAISLPTLGREGLLRIMVMGEYARNQKAIVGIHLPPGLTATKGDLVRTARTYSDSPDSWWDVEIRADRTGDFEIVGTMTVDVGGEYGRDEEDIRLTVSVGADTSWATHSRGVRYERVVGSQRYRYGGTFLVPISQPEQITQDDILQRAQVNQKAPATCRGCGLKSEGVTVRLVVFLDEGGQVTRSQPLPTKLQSGEANIPGDTVLAAAREALTRWRFSPSRTGTRSVADYIVVSVDVKPAD
jgi:hypothetical protein